MKLGAQAAAMRFTPIARIDSKVPELEALQPPSVLALDLRTRLAIMRMYVKR